jgi:hypothetical protein
VDILVYFSHFGILHQEKSGNPGLLLLKVYLTLYYINQKPKPDRAWGLG